MVHPTQQLSQCNYKVILTGKGKVLRRIIWCAGVQICRCADLL